MRLASFERGEAVYGRLLDRLSSIDPRSIA
jgi:hypothetical protein